MGRRLGVLGLVAAAAVTFFALGGDDVLRDTDRIEDLLTDSGPWGPVGFVLSMWALQPLGPPGLLWMVPAGLVWPAPVAIALSWVGNMGSSTIAFGFARWAGRDWVGARLPARVARYDERLRDGGVMPVLVLRVVTGQLPPADWLLGVSNVRFRDFFVGTAIGILPGIFFFVVVGSSLFDLLRDAPPGVWIAAFVLGAAIALARRLRIRRAA